MAFTRILAKAERKMPRIYPKRNPVNWDISSIMEIMPHRYPFLLVDRIVDLKPGKTVTGIKNVTINEPFFQGHFPGHPIMPAVLITAIWMPRTFPFDWVHASMRQVEWVMLKSLRVF